MKLTSRKMATGLLGTLLASGMLVALPASSQASASSPLASDSTLSLFA